MANFPKTLRHKITAVFVFRDPIYPLHLCKFLYDSLFDSLTPVRLAPLRLPSAVYPSRSHGSAF